MHVWYNVVIKLVLERISDTDNGNDSTGLLFDAVGAIHPAVLMHRGVREAT